MGTLAGALCSIRMPFPVEPVPRVPQHPPDEMPDEGATTGTSHDALLHARASAPNANSCAPAEDEHQGSACARSVPTALLHPCKAGVTLPLSSSMEAVGKAGEGR